MASVNRRSKHAWTEEKTLELIELYKEREELWNPLSHRYHLKNLKLDGWSKVTQTLEVPVEVCKAKMTSLLASFRREKRKMKKSKGRGTNDVYKSSWFAFKSMEFLNNRTTPMTDFCSATTHTQNKDQNEGEVEADADAEAETDAEADGEVEAEPEVVASTDRDTSTPPLHKKTSTRIRSNGRTTSDNAVIEEVMEIIRNIQKRDHIQAFGLSVVERMRQLKRRNQILLMQIINTALCERELSELESESGSERASGSTD
ncbi:uncharacterized protein LOC128896743 [Hylaeus anthracinus]|uniref:uncharacterized protein LOC128881801 n=1 Tax=Hylaeus volcanicus TaxID=313075 RepID=UPI0023B84F27|nr:uncharacterized protein LOC128881801 [Hylaeus volcanicus]XP_054016170.1 uncharacterized protein LOC128896743 [Hylaeus anthracinus]